jgi:uncharacterized protein (TIGR02391 family)
MWLLGRLSAIDDGNRGRNLIAILLDELFLGTGGIGNMIQVDQTGIPTGGRAQRTQMKNRLEDAYSLLLSRNWIAQDPSSGDSFCRITEDGSRQLAQASGPDAERVAFAATALGFDLHPALRKRQVDVYFRRGDFETALRESATFLEDAIRTLAVLPASTLGVTLASQAFAKAGPLTDPNEHPGQATGLQNLFMGFFGAVRNLLAHTGHRYADPEEAFELLMLVNYLTSKLDAAAQRISKPLP